MNNPIKILGLSFFTLALQVSAVQSQETIIVSKGNPIITNKYTADPAARVNALALKKSVGFPHYVDYCLGTYF